MDGLRKLYEGFPNKISFIDEVIKFWSLKDPQILTTAPIAENKMVDLFELYHQVSIRGGFDVVCTSQRWSEVSIVCGVQSTQIVFQMYQMYLLPFEKTAKMAAQQLGMTVPPAYTQPPVQQNVGGVSSAHGTQLINQPVYPSYYGAQPQQQHPSFPAPPSYAHTQMPSAPKPLLSTGVQSSVQSGSSLYRPLNTGVSRMPITAPAPKPLPTAASGMSANVQKKSGSAAQPPAVTSTATGPSASSAGNTYANFQANQQTNAEKISTAIKYLDSTDVNVVIRGVNVLLQKSFEGEAVASNTLTFDSYPALILSLGDLLQTINPLAAFVQLSNASHPIRSKGASTLSSLVDYENVWHLPEIASNQVFKALARVADENILLLNTLSIIRNMSFDISNETALASSTPILQTLVSLLLCAADNCWSGAIPEVSVVALEILINIGSKLDFSGRRRQTLQSNCWLDDCSSYDPKAKKQLHARLHHHLSPQSLPDYLYATEILLGAMYSIVISSIERSLVLRTVELFSRIAASSDNITVFAKCPDHLITFFVEFLCTSNCVVDPFQMMPTHENSDSGMPMPAPLNMNQINKYPDQQLTRISKIPSSVGPFFSEMNDLECRDAALELLANLASMSHRLQVRIAAVPNVLQILLRIIEISKPSPERGAYVQRSDPGAAKAAAILTSLASRNATAAKFLAVEATMCMEAMQDDLIGDLVCGNCLNFYSLGTSIQATVIPMNPMDTLSDEFIVDHAL